jgi:NTP pyrophosphatase (non-canonical NTP hydrolase)
MTDREWAEERKSFLDVAERAPGIMFSDRAADTRAEGWQKGARVYVDIAEERRRAHLKHAPHGGSVEDKPFDEERWLPILVEEVGEAAKEINEFSLGVTSDKRYQQLLRYELVQVAAMTCAWIEAIDRAS